MQGESTDGKAQLIIGSVCNDPMSSADRLILKHSLDLYAEKTKNTDSQGLLLNWRNKCAALMHINVLATGQNGVHVIPLPGGS